MPGPTRTAWLAARIAEAAQAEGLALGRDAEQAPGHAGCVALLRWSGCTANAPEFSVLMGDDVGGMAVHIAARVCDLAAPGEVLTSGTVFGTVVGSGLEFEHRGMRALRGVPGRWPISALVS